MKICVTKKYAEERLTEYEKEMFMQELSRRTIAKYMADISQWLGDMGDVITKENVMQYKTFLCERFKAASVNSKIISINRYLKWLGYCELCVQTKRAQTVNVMDKIITKEDYYSMLRVAEEAGKQKIFYIMKTIAGTGIRIGELKYVTVAAVKNGYTQIWNKGKYRNIYFSDQLCRELTEYCREMAIEEGVIFEGRYKGRAITSASVWKSLKNIAKQAEIPVETVYPHSLRHLFAKSYMEKIGDITELADLLGHSRLETTWIYTKTTLSEKRKRLNMLDL